MTGSSAVQSPGKPANAGLARCFSLALTTLTLATCTVADPSSGTVERDSLGVTIIESASPAWAESEGWSVEDEPVLDFSVSGTGEPHELALADQKVHPVDGGALLAASERPSWAREEAEAGLIRADKALILVSSSGELVDTLAVVVGTESVLLPAEEGWSDARPLFGKGSHVAVGDDRIVVGTAELMGYRVLDFEGRATEIVRVPGYDLTLDATLLDAERAARLEVNPSPAMKEHLERLPTPERRPAYSNLLVYATGAVWVEEHRA